MVDELILVVPREAIEATGVLTDGLIQDGDVIARFLAVAGRTAKVMLRERAENDPRWLQPIPLAYIRWRDQILTVPGADRDPTDRLYRHPVTWVGGHVDVIADAETGTFEEIMRRTLSRELTEELPTVPPYPASLVGLVWDSSTERSRMHLGIVHRIAIPAEDGAYAGSLERPLGTAEQLATLMVPKDFVVRHDMEPWSRSIVTARIL